MTLVVDASVAIKWVLAEADSDRARALVGAEPLLAPDFLTLECANVLAMQVRRGIVDAQTAQAAMRTISSAPLRLAPTPPLVAEAQRLAINLGQTAYDCLYLALAEVENARLVTADSRFVDALVQHPAYAARVRRL